MNNIEIAILKQDTIIFLGHETANKIDSMNTNQINALRKKIDTLRQNEHPSNKELREKKRLKEKDVFDWPSAKKENEFPTHRQLVDRKRKIRANKQLAGPEISVIIPYMHTPERYPLLMACLSSLNYDHEVCVVEIGKKRNIFLPPENYEYLFVNYNKVMHRGWALNLGARHLATGRKLVLLDADVIIPDNFYNVVKKCNYPAVAWSKMFYLNERETEDYVKRKLGNGENGIFKEFAIEEKSDVIKTPRLDGPAGGITVIPRDIFFQLKGVPEDFEGTWGGPDNALMGKLRANGYPFKTLGMDSIHLYHPKNTPRKNNIALKAREMLKWSRNQWGNHINNLGNQWGSRHKVGNQINTKNRYQLPDYMTIGNLRNIVVNNRPQEHVSQEQVIDSLIKSWSGFNRDTLQRVCNTKEPLVSLAMLSLLRTDTMLSMLNHWNDTRYIKFNIAFNVQGEEWLSDLNRQVVKEKVNTFFEDNYLTFTRSNRGTGIPRHNMVHKALDFNTPYIMTTDDDMFFPPGSVEALISIMEDNPELGAVDMWVHPNLNAWYIGKDKMIYKKPKSPFGYVDGMGSASMIVRREVFNTCDYDHNYYVGWADIDFCMQMRQSKWKLGILAIPDYKALNFKNAASEKSTQYRQYRHDMQAAGNSACRFQDKWGKQI